VGLRNFLNRRSLPAEAEAPGTGWVATPVERALLTPEQLADLDAARAELLQLAAEVGVKSLNACPPGREPLARRSKNHTNHHRAHQGDAPQGRRRVGLVGWATIADPPRSD